MAYRWSNNVNVPEFLYSMKDKATTRLSVYPLGMILLREKCRRLRYWHHRHISFSLWNKSIHYQDRCYPITPWDALHKYIWARNGLNNLDSAMADGLSESFRMSLLSSISDQCDVNVVAEKSDEYISQACERTFDRVWCNHKGKLKPLNGTTSNVGRNVHSLAVKTGERVTTHADKQKQTAACRAYRSCQQLKKNARISRHAYMKYNLPYLMVGGIFGE